MPVRCAVLSVVNGVQKLSSVLRQYGVQYGVRCAALSVVYGVQKLYSVLRQYGVQYGVQCAVLSVVYGVQKLYSVLRQYGVRCAVLSVVYGVQKTVLSAAPVRCAVRCTVIRYGTDEQCRTVFTRILSHIYGKIKSALLERFGPYFSFDCRIRFWTVP